MSEGSSLVSERGQKVLSKPGVLMKFTQRVTEDSYDKETNPNGFVDLGQAENKLCEDIILAKLDTVKVPKSDATQMYYPDLKGLPSFRAQLKQFFRDRFHPSYEIDPDQIVVLSGATAVNEVLAFSLAEQGDYFLLPTPFYYRIVDDVGDRAGVSCFEVPLKSQDGDGKPFSLTVNDLETAFKKAKQEGKRVKGLYLINPHNPLGEIYTEQQLMSFLKFAERHGLHIIVDEIYALSAFEENVKFVSVMSLPIPDPQRTHFIWGFSKDFGLSGFRCGILHTRNNCVIEYAASVSIFQQTSSVIQRRLEMIISDTDWLDEVYFPTCCRRLRNNFKMARDYLEQIGVSVYPSKAGVFIWANMSKFLSEKTFEAEADLQERLMVGKVYILGGKCFVCSEPGWFRIVFAHSTEILMEGLSRIKKVLQGTPATVAAKKTPLE